LSDFFLDFYGVRVAVRGDAEALADLASDFAWFRAAPGRADLELELARRAPAAGAAPRAWPRSSRYRVSDAGPIRSVNYSDGARLAWDFDRRRGLAEAERSWRLRELGYLAVLSRSGEELENRGLHRVHALGFVRRGGAGLLLLPSGGGKSVLGLEMLGTDGWTLLSEDTPLVARDGRARPFPLRLGFLPDRDLGRVPAALKRDFRRLGREAKIVVDLDFFRARVAAEAPVRWIIVGSRRPGSAASAAPCSRGRATAALFDALVVGRGVAQLSELMLRPGASRNLPRLAGARWAAARALISGARPLTLRIGDDPAAALAALDAALDAASIAGGRT
jgi:hypothetical protein